MMAIRSALAAAVSIVVVLPAARAQAPAGDNVVVSAQWLAQHVKDRDLVILQTGTPDDYAKEHIAGARYVKPGDLDEAMTGATMKMDELPAPTALQGRLEKLGISDRSTIVVTFGSGGVPYATRVIFLLAYAGLERVSLLDGGVGAWKAAGQVVTRAVPAVTPGHIAASANPALGVGYSYVQARSNAPKVKLIDARDSRYYNGPRQTEMGSGMAAGHIPGAVSMPYSTLFDDSMHMLPTAKLEQLFRSAGVQRGDTVVAYCHVGIQATVVLLAARMLGNPIHLYVGSFHDWSDHNLPTVGGPQ